MGNSCDTGIWSLRPQPRIKTQEPTAETSQPIEIDLEMEINSSASSTVGEKEKATSSAGSQPMEVTSKQTEAASTSDGNLYPSLAALPRNKKVADALDQMLAMGFKNDDGWLTELLNVQDGNIAKVLDLIQLKAQGKK